MPRKPRAVKSAAPSPSPSIEVRTTSRSRSRSTKTAESVENAESSLPITEEEEVGDESPAELDPVEAGDDDPELEGVGAGESAEDVKNDENENDDEAEAESSKTSMENRLAKLRDLRIRMVRHTFPSHVVR